jgi:hypothetical protein
MSSSSIPLHHAVTIRLTNANYLLWRAQLLPYLRSSNLLGYLDGTTAAPSTHIAASTDGGANLVPNPAYASWYNTDHQQVLSGLLPMSEEVLLGCR